MGALIWRDLAMVSRAPALWVSAALYTSGLAFFVVVWGDGVPVAGAASNWRQFIAAERILLAVLLPWTAARCGVSSRRELVLTGVVTAKPPAALVLARCAALGLALIAVALAALPVVVLMQQIAGASAGAVALALVPIAALAIFVASVTTTVSIVLEAPVRVWGMVTAVSLTALAVIPSEPGATPLWLLAAAAALALGIPQMRSKLTYLAEDVA